jgi:hypothetical protein
MRIIHLACAVLLAACAGARPSVAQTEAERVVQAHHDAYNRRDAVALLAVYAPDAVIVAHPADTMHRGAEEIREYHKQIFQLLPSLRVEVRAHQAEGNTVVDELLYHGWPCGGTFSERAVFQVQDGRIRSITNTTIDDGVEAMMISGAGPICFPATDTAGEATP